MRNLGSIGGTDFASLVGARWKWLGHPAFLAGVLLLALNDRVLKSTFPGWWTGKLSDVAGVAVVAVLVAVMVGPRLGVALTGIAFTLLKTVPGVAELVSPVLGGVTLRDPTDLMGLTILIPLWFLLSPDDARRSRHRTPAESVPRRRPIERRGLLRTAMSVAVPLCGAIVAVVATTATSCSPDPAVLRVVNEDGVLFAEVREGSYTRWASTRDGGASWQEVDAPVSTPPSDRDSATDPDVTGELQACDADGTCWRIRERRVIERRAVNAAWREEVRLSDSEFHAISTGCTGGQVGVLGSIAMSDSDDSSAVVASLGADGVLVRTAEGTWSRQGVLSATDAAPDPAWWNAAVVVMFGVPVVVSILLFVGRRRLPSWQWGLAVLAGGWFTTLVAGVFLSMSTTPGGARSLDALASTSVDIPVITMLGGMLVTTVATIAVAARPRRARTTPGDWGPPPT